MGAHPARPNLHFPPPANELTDRGLVKRLIRKQPGDGPKDAIARAHKMPWWPSVAEARPFSCARFWIFLVKREAGCS
jgi:hypothetical protein